jgi:ribonucleotide reductase beta subunit family protein with ferritin-like domain
VQESKLVDHEKRIYYCEWFTNFIQMLNELKTAITAFIRNISQADLQKVFENEIKWVQACIDTRGHHFQHLF